MRALFVLLALPLAACGVETAIGCDFRDGSTNGPEARCQERTDAQAPGFDAMCEALEGTAIDGGCDLAEAVAGCTQSLPGGAVTDWYYAPETVESVTQRCEDDGSELIMP